MKAITDFAKKAYEFSALSTRFINSHFGLTDAPTRGMAVSERNALYRYFRLWSTCLVLCAASLFWLLWRLRTKVDLLLVSERIAVDLESLYWGWQSSVVGAMLTAVTFVALTVVALRLRRKYTVRRTFVLLPIVLSVVACCYKPIARFLLEEKLQQVFEKGLDLFHPNTWDECYFYYSRIYQVFPKTFVSDNALGRMAGAKYYSREYAIALAHYGELLSRFPNTEIYDNIRRSTEWTMRGLGRNASPGECATLFDKHRLAEHKLSVFCFYLDQPEFGEAGKPQLFASASRAFDAERHTKLASMLVRYPDDPWAARAAFLIGDAERLKAYPSSPYTKAAGVVEGWHYQTMQNYDAASILYRDFLNANPQSEASWHVRKLLARCYLASPNLKECLNKLLADKPASSAIPTSTYFLFLERFAYTENVQDAIDLFGEFGSQLPGQLASDMACLLHERLELDPPLDRSDGSRYLRYAKRTKLLAESPSTDTSYDSVGDYMLAKFDYGTNLIRFFNSRLRQGENDQSWRHFLDRNYGETRTIWDDSAKTDYTALLRLCAEKRFLKVLEGAGSPAAAFAILREHETALKDPSLLTAPAIAYLQKLEAQQVVLEDRAIGFIAQSRVPGLTDYVARLASSAMDNLSATSDGVQTAFAISAAVPNERTCRRLQEICTLYLQQGETNDISRCTHVHAQIKASAVRSLVGRYLFAELSEALCKRLSSEVGEQARDELAALGSELLKQPATYPIAMRTFEALLQSSPRDPLRHNWLMWIAWINCFLANEHLQDRSRFTQYYKRAHDIYQQVASESKQLRIKNLATESARRIRRKLTILEAGAMKTTDFQIPEELILFADPRERLSGTAFSLHPGTDAKHAFTSVGFTRSNIVLNCFSSGPTILDHKLWAHPSGEVISRGTGKHKGQTIVAIFHVTQATISAEITLIASGARMDTKNYVGKLVHGDVYAPHRKKTRANSVLPSQL
ncbi:MAG TPA: hypothetical protein VEH27_10930 [Methylomirabilota bacterium]|nr:hypothetical protein [Methylomirabilota bacterium]